MSLDDFFSVYLSYYSACLFAKAKMGIWKGTVERYIQYIIP